MLKRWLSACLLACTPLFAWSAIDVNKATVEELETIKGIGPNIAARIVQERSQAPFKDWEDFIARTRGVGTQSAGQFSAGGLTIQNRSYTGTKTAPSTPSTSAANTPSTSASAKK